MRLSLLVPAVASVTSGFARGTAASAANASAFVVSANSNIYRVDRTETNHTARALASSSGEGNMTVDPEYPGTAVERMNAVRARVAQLADGDELNGRWEDVRRKLLWAGGLRDLPDAVPGQVQCSLEKAQESR